MCDVCTKASTHYTVPSWVMITVEFFPDEICYTSMNIPTCNGQGKRFPIDEIILRKNEAVFKQSCMYEPTREPTWQF